MNVVEVLHRQALLSPNAVAFTDVDSGSSLTFAELSNALARAGGWLRGQLPTDGARVAILADAGIDYLCADYGAMHAGRVRVPLDPALTTAELAGQITDAGAELLLFGERQEDVALEIAGSIGLRIHPLADVRDTSSSPVACVSSAPGDLASLNYTGGSTGHPKAVMHSHASLLAVLQNVAMVRGAGPGDVLLNVRPLWPIAAIVVLAHLAAGGTVVNGGGFAPDRFLEQLRLHRATHVSLVPIHLHRMLAEPRDPFDLPDLRAAEIGAAAVPPDLFARATRAFGPRLAVLYGLTEAPWSCYRPAADSALVDPGNPATLGNVGRPLFTSEITIVADGATCAMGDVGEVLIRGPHVMQGYWRQPDRTAAAMADGWFHTGDLGLIDADGRLFIRGRIKSIIRSGGKSVVPEEVEDTLREHADVVDAAVIGLPEAEWGEVVAAGVVLRAGAATNAPALLAYCREKLAGHKRPRRLRILSDIPRSHYGKVQQARLAALLVEQDQTT